MKRKTPLHTAANGPQALRHEAEARAQAAERLTPALEEMAPEAIGQMLHELRVYQIELEMQNEELRRSQAELSVVQARYFNLYDLAPVGYVTLSEQGLILEANLSAASMLGTARSRLVKRPLSRFIFKHDLAVFHQHRNELFASGHSQSCELRLVKPDGGMCWAQLEANLAQDDDGNSMCRIVLNDITERKQAEWALEESRRMLMKAEEMGKVGGWELDVETKVLRWTDEVYHLHEVEPAYVPTVDSAIQFYTPASRPVIERAVQRAIMHGEPFDLELEIITAKGNLRSMHSIGNADLERHRIVGVIQDITEQKMVTQALRESEAKYRKLHESMMDAFVSVDMTGRIIDCNLAYQEMLGYTQEELRRLTYIDLTPEKWHDLESRVVAEQIFPSGYSELYQKEYRRKDGSVIPVELRVYLIRDGGGDPASMWAVIRDISERKHAQQVRREFNELLALFMRHAPIHSYIKSVTPEGIRILYCSDNYEDMLGLPAAEIEGKSMAELFPPEVAARMDAVDMQVVASGNTYRGEQELNGRIYSLIKFPIIQGSRTLVGGYTMDITERKQAEQAIQEARTRYQEIFEMAVDGILLGSPDGLITGANRQMQVYAGRSLDQLTGLHYAELFDQQELRDKPLKHDQLNAERPVVTERFLVRPDGSRLVVETHAKRMPNGSYQTIICDITERKRAEEELRESNELLSLFLRHSPIYSHILSVEPGCSRVLQASDNYQQMLGMPLPEIIGKSVHELFPAEIAARQHRIDLQVVTSGETFRSEEDFNGRAYSLISFPIIQGSHSLVGGYTIDITERKQAEQTLREWNQALERRVAERTLELQQSEARFRQLTEATFEGIAIAVGGVLMDCNSQLGAMHGYKLAEMIGRPITEFVAPESQELVTKRHHSGHESTYEYVALRKDGTVFPAEVHGRSGMWQGRSVRISAVRDVSAVKETASRIQAQQVILAHAQRLAAVSEISAGIIHQLGQPLCAMGVNTAVALSRIGGCDTKICGAQVVLKDVEADIARMREVVVHLRTLAHPDHLTRVQVDLNDVVKGISQALQEEAESRHFLLSIEYGRDLPQVLADAVQLSQVILNLVRNAFDACNNCPPERRTVQVTTRRLAADAVELSVRDAGTGIAAEDQDRLFAPFFTTKPQGLGIGLRLSRTIVEAHDGSIEGGNNAAGPGATFRVVLPVRPESGLTQGTVRWEDPL